MRQRFWSIGLALVVLASGAAADDKHDAHAGSKAKHAGLERLKKLAGEWVMADAKGQPTTQVVSIFKVTAAGSAVHETLFPGQAHEMVSVYHLDGADLVMTHYCAVGNQPRFKVDAKGTPNQMRFVFAGGSNLNPAKDMHMHEGTLTFVDDNTIEAAWQGYANGKPDAGHKVLFKLVRKK